MPNNQGKLFETRIVYDSTDPVMSEPHEEYFGEPTHQEVESESPSSVSSGSAESQPDVLPLDILKLTVECLSAANQRSGFGRAPRSRVQESANRRHLSLREAEDQAHRNAGELKKEAESHYTKVRALAREAISLTALFAPNPQMAEVASFDEFVERISGSQNRNLRRSIRRSGKWLPRYTDLLLKWSGGDKLSDVTNSSAEHRTTVTKNKYLPLLPSFVAERYSKLDPLDERMSRVWEYTAINYQGYPKGVMMSSADRESFVRNPEAYKRSLSEGGTLREDTDYKHKLSSKIVQLQNRRNDFTARALKLHSVMPIVNGTMQYGDNEKAQQKAQQDAATKLADAHKILSQEIELIGEVRNWSDETVIKVKQRLDNVLLNGKKPDGTSVSRQESWLEAIDAAREHLSKQAAVFDTNIQQLDGRSRRSARSLGQEN